MKNLFIFHYHFLPGGVTDVVISAVRSYLEFSRTIGNITIVSGRAENLDTVSDKITAGLSADLTRRFSVEHIPLIDYIERIDKSVTVENIVELLKMKFTSPENIWWIHNYHLGKNPLFTAALLEIADETDQNMVYHIHDFPECSRYQLLDGLKRTIDGDIYTQAENVIYAVINSRDYDNLRNAGISEDRIFLLENPLKISSEDFQINKMTSEKLSGYFGKRFPRWRTDEGYMLYPVRSIRRKNIGEAAFISLLTEKNIIVTLSGVSERERSYSERCEALFRDGPVPGLFGIGYETDEAEVSFHELIASSSLILSSSIQEGFGYLFLNSINWGKPLIARELDMLESFKPALARFKSHFYNALLIPSSEIDIPNLNLQYEKKVDKLNDILPEDLRTDIKHRLKKMTEEKTLDFSYLPLSMQIETIERAGRDGQLADRCRELNKSLIDKINNYFFADCSHRRDLLEEKWSYERYSLSTDEILHSFSRSIPLPDHMAQKRPIYETLVQNFASPPYLRLLYDD